MKQFYLRSFFQFILMIVFPAIATSGGNVVFRDLEFVRNDGQWVGDFLYKANTANVYMVRENKGFTTLSLGQFFSNDQLINKNYYNYLFGSDPIEWKSDIYPYFGVDYRTIKHEIDLRVIFSSFIGLFTDNNDFMPYSDDSSYLRIINRPNLDSRKNTYVSGWGGNIDNIHSIHRYASIDFLTKGTDTSIPLSWLIIFMIGYFIKNIFESIKNKLKGAKFSKRALIVVCVTCIPLLVLTGEHINHLAMIIGATILYYSNKVFNVNLETPENKKTEILYYVFVFVNAGLSYLGKPDISHLIQIVSFLFCFIFLERLLSDFLDKWKSK